MRIYLLAQWEVSDYSLGWARAKEHKGAKMIYARVEDDGHNLAIHFNNEFSLRGKEIIRAWFKTQIGDEDHPAEMRWTCNNRLRIVPYRNKGADHIVTVRQSVQNAIQSFNQICSALAEIKQAARAGAA